METFVDIGLRNAVLAVPLALIALVLGLAIRRPALLHLLWILVLLRLVAPPIWNVTVPWRPLAAKTPVVVPDQVSEIPPLAPEATASWRPNWSIFDVEPVVPDLADPAPLAAEPLPVVYVVEEPSVAQQAVAAVPLLPWQWFVGGVWLMGSALVLALTTVRIARFALALRRAPRASDRIQRQANDIARRLGLRRAPAVLLVSGRLSPMLWGLFLPPRLILPESLWRRLDLFQRSALLAHELSHYRRGDHWVRGLELLAGVLFWWHPVVWLARYYLREAEEQCCDAWVVWALPDLRRDYATAIVDTVGFLSESRSVLPALASGLDRARAI